MIKIKPDEIAFDIDGVVADTMSSFIGTARREFGITDIRREDITSYWLEDCLPLEDSIIEEILNMILDDPFGTRLEPMDGAVQVLTKIAIQAPLRFVTARSSQGPIQNWLEDVLDAVPAGSIEVIATGRHDAKVDILKELGVKWFVEDHLETCHEIWAAGIGVLLYDHPWNQGECPFPRIKGWHELERMLDV